MNKLISTILMLAVMTSMSACAKQTEVTGSTEGSTEGSKAQPVKLTNRMTDKELQTSKETDFILLDHPWEQYMTKDDSNTKDFSGYKDKIFFIPEIGSIVYGNPVFNALPNEGYDGGAGTVVFMHMDDGTGNMPVTEIKYDSFDDLKTKLRAEWDKEIAGGYPKVPADEEYDSMIKLYEAVIEGKTEMLDKADLDEYLEYYYSGGSETAANSYYWQMNDDKVSAIKDNIREYHLYDEEFDSTFVVHVTTPSGYDQTREYPALVLTDAVWRFNDVTSLYDAMAQGKKDPQIIITVGFEYNIDSWDNEVRGNILCDHKKEFLDFITDNMMPYLSEKYSFDYNRSTLFGHSQGGVFAHYAAFNYDLYENRPFARYIIASPTFWTPYFTGVADYEKYKTEYGFFDRNSTYDRQLIITAGDMEDEDYQEYYGDNDSTTQGVVHLKERLDGYGVTSYSVKMYNSHHYQYVSQMLLELV